MFAANHHYQGEWVWVPDDYHAYVPGRKMQTLYDGSVEVETEDGKVRCIHDYITA